MVNRHAAGCLPRIQDYVRERLAKEHSSVPVFLEQDLMDKYYNGFSNDVLWPLFHYVPLPMYKPGMEKKFDNGLWEAYKEANKRWGREGGIACFFVFFAFFCGM